MYFNLTPLYNFFFKLVDYKIPAKTDSLDYFDYTIDA